MKNYLNRRSFLKSAAAAGASAVMPHYLPAASTKRPNIILIMADDLGYECIGANGGTSYKTPVLDRLAKTGARFEHCYAQPLCTPSRVKIMTGKYNVRNYDKFGYLDPRETTFANILKKAGYATCIAGKWQLNGSRETNEDLLNRPADFGFDRWCLWQLTTSGRTRVDGKRVDGRYVHPVLSIDGKLHGRMKGKYGPKVCTDFILDFIDEKKDKPFFVYYPMILTHCPFTITPDSPQWKDPTKRKASRSYKGKPKYFPDMVSYMDKLVGMITDKLDELGLRDNTLIMFTGDNGTDRPIVSTLNGQKVAGRKGSTIDWGTHVPLIANWPGVIPAGRAHDDLVDFSDFLPTICETANVRIPNDPTIDGRSFLPQLKGEKGNPRKWVYCWYSRSGKRANASEFARTRRYKLYRNGRFYDVLNDVQEKNPLKDDELDDKARRIKAMLREVLDKYENVE